MKLLIDGDLLVHRSTVACERDVSFDGRYHIVWSDSETSWNILTDTIEDLLEQSGLSEYVLVFSDTGEGFDNNFRKKLGAQDYKSNRVGMRKPLAYWAVRERCAEKFECRQLPNIEADDTMGLLMTKYPNDYAIWTLDKDLKQIPGHHLGDDELYVISPEAGEEFFYYQILAGDPVDGYTGCPSIGKERAWKIVYANMKLVPTDYEIKRGARKGQTETRWVEEPCTDMWETIVSYYEANGLNEADALYNARMARILKHGEYKNGEPILWTPNKRK